MSLGSKIKNARRMAMLSVRGLAKLTGINEGHLSRIENDKIQPRIDTIKRIAEALRTDWHNLIE